MSFEGDSRTTWLYTIFAIVVALLAFDALLLSRDLRNVFDLQDQMAVSYHRIESLDGLISSLKDAEAGQRGYLLTGLDSYLLPYDLAGGDITGYMTRLDTLYGDRRPQRLDAVRASVENKVGELAETVRLYSQGEEEEALALFRSDSGMVLMDSLRRMIADLREAEELTLLAASKVHEQNEERVIATFAITTIVALGLVAFLYLFTARDIRQRSRIERALRQHRDELDVRVQTRTHELMEANANLRRSIEELARSNRELEAFAYVASHDLQEPLRKIRVFSGLLLEQELDQLSSDGQHYLQRLQHAAERMSKLINDLLAFSRVRSRQEPFERVDLNVLLRDVLDELKATGRDTDAVVTVDPLPTVEGDPVQLRQLFESLLDNAIKFRREDVPPVVSVEVESMDLDGEPHARICVRDNGIGFEPRYADRIFKPFQRLHSQDEFSGTGIGLAICRRIAERHGAVLTAEAQPGVGAKFCLTMPDLPTTAATT